jgi:pyruvate dehydrogenase E1 component
MNLLKPKDLLTNYGIESEVWSVTSFNLLRKDGMEIERKNQLNPTKEEQKTYVEECFEDSSIPVVASTDYMRSYAEQIRPLCKI